MSHTKKTTSQILDHIKEVEERIESESKPKAYKPWASSISAIPALHKEKAELFAELLLRGICPPGGVGRVQSIEESISNARAWIKKRGFEWDREVLNLLLELMSYRQTFHRAAIDGDDIEREWIAYEEATDYLDETTQKAFVDGLLRGFALRAEPIEGR